MNFTNGAGWYVVGLGGGFVISRAFFADLPMMLVLALSTVFVIIGDILRTRGNR